MKKASPEGRVSVSDTGGRIAAASWLAWVVLAVSLSASIWAYRAAESEMVLGARNRFDVRVAQVKATIQDRIEVYEHVLLGARGLFAASKSVERGEWREYLDAVNIAKNYPGIKGIGFVEYVPRSRLKSFLAETRSDGAPDFSVYPGGVRADYFVLKYIEPINDNSGLIGFDIGVDTVHRRPVAELARDRGRPTLSGKIGSGSDTDPRPTFLFLLPIYRRVGVGDTASADVGLGAPVEIMEDRRKFLAGWIYCRIQMKDLMKDILGQGAAEGRDIDFEIFDGIEMSAQSRLYGTEEPAGSAGPPTFVYATTMELGERVWILNVHTRPTFDATADHSRPAWVLLAGLLGSFLLFSITWSLAATRRLAEAQAESMTAKLRSVLETAAEAFIAADESGAITDWNRQAQETFGWSRLEAVGRNMTDLIFPPKSRETVDREMRQFLSALAASGTLTRRSAFMGRRIEFAAIRRGGQEFPVEMTLWPIRAGESFTFNLFVHDITERRLAQKELMMTRDAAEGANRSKSEFLATMSHELRTPLNSLIGFAGIIQENKDGRLTDQQMAYLDRIMDNAKHLLNLINEVLDLSKVEARQMTLEIERVYLDVFVRDTLAQLEGRVLGRDIKLVANLPGPMTPVETDPIKLKQVLINLIGNAIKFTEKGLVTVRVKIDAGRRPTRIDVIDTGVGIPKDKQKLIFEAFRQADTGSSRKYGGTGLGLTISRSLCQLMGYRLEVDSAPGRGSTFSVIIPRNPKPWKGPETDLSGMPEMDVNPPDPVTSAVDNFSGKTALVIDDAPDSRILLTHFLEELGLDVITVATGDQGVHLAKTRRPDLITVDLMMRGKNGVDVIREIRADASLNAIPIVVISAVAADVRNIGTWGVGDSDPAETRAGLPAGLDILSKPVDRQKLLKTLQKNLGATGRISAPGAPSAGVSDTGRPA